MPHSLRLQHHRSNGFYSILLFTYLYAAPLADYPCYNYRTITAVCIRFSKGLARLTSELYCLRVDNKIREFFCQCNLFRFSTFLIHIVGIGHIWHHVFTHRHRPSFVRRIASSESAQWIKIAKLDHCLFSIWTSHFNSSFIISSALLWF